MHYLPLPESAVRQAIDSQAIYLEFRRAEKAAHKFSGGMYFKKDGVYEYLVRTTPRNKQQLLGRRDADTEASYKAFTEGKQQAEERVKTLKEALQESIRLNKALKVGHAPTIALDVLDALEAADLSASFTVVGTHALYAYEAAAGVLFRYGALATQDVDLLWDARKLVQFSSQLKRAEGSMLRVLQGADKSFRRMDGQLESAINGKGFMVDFLRREAIDGDPHPFRFSADEDDIWPVQAKRAELFLSAPAFEQVIFSTTGKMALMRTIQPEVFIEFKRWMAGLENRPGPKRRRDALQADAVEQLLKEKLMAR